VTDEIVYGSVRRCTVHTMAQGCECSWDSCIPELMPTRVPTARYVKLGEPPEVPAWLFGTKVHAVDGIPGDVVYVYAPPDADDQDLAASLPRRVAVIKGIATDDPSSATPGVAGPPKDQT